jgi:hypothetical protein
VELGKILTAREARHSRAAKLSNFISFLGQSFSKSGQGIMKIPEMKSNLAFEQPPKSRKSGSNLNRHYQGSSHFDQFGRSQVTAIFRDPGNIFWLMSWVCGRLTPGVRTHSHSELNSV